MVDINKLTTDQLIDSLKHKETLYQSGNTVYDGKEWKKLNFIKKAMCSKMSDAQIIKELTHHHALNRVQANEIITIVKMLIGYDTNTKEFTTHFKPAERKFYQKKKSDSTEKVAEKFAITLINATEYARKHEDEPFESVMAHSLVEQGFAALEKNDKQGAKALFETAHDYVNELLGVMGTVKFVGDEFVSTDTRALTTSLLQSLSDGWHNLGEDKKSVDALRQILLLRLDSGEVVMRGVGDNISNENGRKNYAKRCVHSIDYKRFDPTVLKAAISAIGIKPTVEIDAAQLFNMDLSKSVDTIYDECKAHFPNLYWTHKREKNEDLEKLNRHAEDLLLRGHPTKAYEILYCIAIYHKGSLWGNQTKEKEASQRMLDIGFYHLGMGLKHPPNETKESLELLREFRRTEYVTLIGLDNQVALNYVDALLNIKLGIIADKTQFIIKALKFTQSIQHVRDESNSELNNFDLNALTQMYQHVGQKAQELYHKQKAKFYNSDSLIAQEITKECFSNILNWGMIKNLLKIRFLDTEISRVDFIENRFDIVKPSNFEKLNEVVQDIVDRKIFQPDKDGKPQKPIGIFHALPNLENGFKESKEIFPELSKSFSKMHKLTSKERKTVRNQLDGLRISKRKYELGEATYQFLKSNLSMFEYFDQNCILAQAAGFNPRYAYTQSPMFFISTIRSEYVKSEPEEAYNTAMLLVKEKTVHETGRLDAEEYADLMMANKQYQSAINVFLEVAQLYKGEQRVAVEKKILQCAMKAKKLTITRISNNKKNPLSPLKDEKGALALEHFGNYRYSPIKLSAFIEKNAEYFKNLDKQMKLENDKPLTVKLESELFSLESEGTYPHDKKIFLEIERDAAEPLKKTKGKKRGGITNKKRDLVKEQNKILEISKRYEAAAKALEKEKDKKNEAHALMKAIDYAEQSIHPEESRFQWDRPKVGEEKSLRELRKMAVEYIKGADEILNPKPTAKPKDEPHVML